MLEVCYNQIISAFSALLKNTDQMSLGTTAGTTYYQYGMPNAEPM